MQPFNFLSNQKPILQFYSIICSFTQIYHSIPVLLISFTFFFFVCCNEYPIILHQYSLEAHVFVLHSRVWHDTAQPFTDVIQQFEAWLSQHNLWEKDKGGCLTRSAFVTCGNWDLKTKVPQQCQVSGIELPPYFKEWINLKDVYLNFYGRDARGMMSMMKQLEIRSLGCHHLGIDDSKNRARVLQRMLADGALMQITAKRNPGSQKVEFLYENRIEHPPRRR